MLLIITSSEKSVTGIEALIFYFLKMKNGVTGSREAIQQASF